ncbi:MAG: hypothetical protein M1823_002073 [Watsoniomyces obsoletus]|nr:MAG: hypothetical protein M1823_002073 [Watsoniomyces obsoletus]
MDLIRRVTRLAVDRRTTRWLGPALLLADAVLCGLIIKKVAYTEIDWRAYMEQVEQYRKGERDYLHIRGGTGPLVYPAAHVYIYDSLYRLTDGGLDIVTAQWLFAGVYLGTLLIVMACYRRAGAPPYIFPLLVLSKRLHSIYLLRLFNDCFAVLALFVAIYAYQRRQWVLGSALFSLGVGIKMSVLLALPAVAMIVYQGHLIGRFLSRVTIHAVVMLGLQILLAWPFMRTNALGYFSRAFEFSRSFLFKWTVNWRFVGEETFGSPAFSLTLLILHVSLLGWFTFTRWIRPSGRSITELAKMAIVPPPPRVQQSINSRIDARYILTTVLAANAIGMLCARSLHYQFYAWLAWGTPFLLWRTGFPPIVQYLLWAVQEWAWNVYPSTDASSRAVVGILAIMVAGVWTGTRADGTKARDIKHNRSRR